MARRKRNRRSLNGLDGQFVRTTGMVIGSTVAAKLILWGAALYLISRARTEPKGSDLQKITEVATRIASPPEFLVENVVPRTVRIT